MTKARSKELPGYAALAALASVSLLSGCGMNGTAGNASNGGGTTPLVRVSGVVHGGQQPVTGSSLQMYTVGLTGNGSAATPLMTPGAVTTDTNGNFSLMGKFSCASTTQVYLVATGGNAGFGNNSALSLMAALGPCSSITTSTFITINELTTVAATTALAPFMSSYTQIGATGSNPAGLVNAFNMAQVLVNSGTGQPTPATGMTLPVAELNTLADILAACVNTGGPSSTYCTTLLTATGASETIDAGLAIAKAPGSTAFTALWSLPPAQTAFVPTLTARPNDFTVMVRYTGTELASPGGIAIDATGNAWVTNTGGSSVVKLPSLSGTFSTSTFTGGGLLTPRGLSIDRAGNVWIANTGGNDVVKLNSLGAVLSGAGYTSGGLSTPIAIANDSAGNAWVANFYGNSMTELSSAGAPVGTNPITASLALPTAIALDTTGRVAVANAGTGAVCLFSNAAVLQQCSTDGTLFGATSVAVSTTGNVALAGSVGGPTLAGAFTLATSSNGTVNAASPVSGGGLAVPTAAAFDGAGVAWFANATSISAFSGATALSGTAGFGAVSAPSALAVDASGNIWTANAGDNSVAIFVGVATPVATPLAANVGP